jgi:hypothetical protein
MYCIMLSEHLVYSAAIAIIAGMLFFRFSGRDNSWIIILMSWAPDFDGLATNFRYSARGSIFEDVPIFHGTFHNIAFMVLFGIIVALLLWYIFPILFSDALIFTLTGIGAHLFEDALVYPVGYAYLWPFSSADRGLGWLNTSGTEEAYNASFFHVANTEVLFAGIVLLLLAILVRTRIEGSGWIRWYMPEKVYRRYFS